jgi:2-oxoglutarate dehydrogenase E2 component (dihydrolipoamide succinyltransferase)
MELEVKIPSVGESIKQAMIAQWFKHDGEAVQKDEPLFAIETDKVTLEVVSPANGVLHIKLQEGETAAIGALAAVIDAMSAEERPDPKAEKKTLVKTPAPADKPSMGPPATPPEAETPTERSLPEEKEPRIVSGRPKPAAGAAECSGIEGTGQAADQLSRRWRISKRETQPESASTEPVKEKNLCRGRRREPGGKKAHVFHPKRIAQHLVASRIPPYTTFNEIDM